MEIHTIQAEPREKVGSKKVKQLRAEGFVPATLYGSGIKAPLSLQVSAREFAILLEKSEESSLIDVQLGTKTYKTLLRNIERNPLKNEYFAVDFFAPNLKETTEVEVTLHFEGVSEAEKAGNLVIKNHSSILIEALPTELPEYIEVDLSILKTSDDVIRAGDIALPKGVSLQIDPEEIMVYTEEPRKSGDDDSLTSAELDAIEATQTKLDQE